MVVVQRKKLIENTELPISGHERLPNNKGEIKTSGVRFSGWRFLSCGIAFIFSILLFALQPMIEKNDYIELKDMGNTVQIKLQKNEHGEVTLGPHSVSLLKTSDFNLRPMLTRVYGDALLNVPVVEISPQKWSGNFTFPMEGTFGIEVDLLYGCNGNMWTKKLAVGEKFKAVGNPNMDGEKIDDSGTFEKGSWITKGRVKINNHEKLDNSKTLSSYLWANTNFVIEGKNHTFLLPDEKSGHYVLKEAVWTSNEAYSFDKLGNYELVCWIGSKSASNIISAFKSLRPKLFPHQRPFKFHYYEMTNFTTPDTSWETGRLKDFRKCKQIFISMDEYEQSATQLIYMEQVKKFIKHLLNAFNEEETFPALIWMLTVNDSVYENKNCHSAHLKVSTNHPCNDALYELFRINMFPDRVQLLDNTDITDPAHGTLKNESFTIIAMRIYAIVGKQVKTWRDAGIAGTIHGLKTKTGLKPNFQQEVYDWTQKLDK